MPYVIGSAAVTNAPARLQNTCQGDSFYTLATAYGTTPAFIANLQPALRGKTLTNKLVQSFVKGLPGWSSDVGLRPYKAGTSPSDNPGTVGPDGRPEGFAQFTASTQLMLPDQPRLDGRVPRGATATPGAPPTTIGPSEAELNVGLEVSIPPIAYALGVGLIVLLVINRKDKKSRKAAGAGAASKS